jgi:hypothetical protein
VCVGEGGRSECWQALRSLTRLGNPSSTPICSTIAERNLACKTKQSIPSLSLGMCGPEELVAVMEPRQRVVGTVILGQTQIVGDCIDKSAHIVCHWGGLLTFGRLLRCLGSWRSACYQPVAKIVRCLRRRGGDPNRS